MTYCLKNILNQQKGNEKDKTESKNEDVVDADFEEVQDDKEQKSN